MSAFALIAVLAAGAAAAAPAPTGSYNCSAQGMLASFRTGGAWRSVQDVKPKNTFQYQNARISFLPGNRVAIDLPADVINMSGDYYLQRTKDGVTSWVAPTPARCGLLDAECTPMAAFLPDDAGATLVISTPVVVTVGQTKQIGNFQISYNCERAS